MDIQIKRIYQPPEPWDGLRVLVDRVWPRGLSKEQARLDLWLKEAAPSNDLRKWFNHEREKWPEFQRRYFAELDGQPDVVQKLLALAAEQRLTLLFSARDEQFNHAMALKKYLQSAKNLEE